MNTELKTFVEKFSEMRGGEESAQLVRSINKQLAAGWTSEQLAKFYSELHDDIS